MKTRHPELIEAIDNLNERNREIRHIARIKRELSARNVEIYSHTIWQELGVGEAGI